MFGAMRSLATLAAGLVWLRAAAALACGATPAPFYTIESVYPNDGQEGVVRDGAIEFRLKAWKSEADEGHELVIRVRRTSDDAEVLGVEDRMHLEEGLLRWAPRSVLEPHETYSVELTTSAHPRNGIAEPHTSATTFTTSDALTPPLQLNGDIRISLRPGTAPKHDCRGAATSNCQPCPVNGERAALYADVELPSVSGGFSDYGYASWLTLNDAEARSFDGRGEGEESERAELVDLLFYRRLTADEATTISVEIPREDAAYKACFGFNAWDAFGHAQSAEPVCIRASQLEDALAELDHSKATGGCSVSHLSGYGDWSWFGILIAAAAARLARCQQRTRLRASLASLVVLVWIAGCSERPDTGGGLVDAGEQTPSDDEQLPAADKFWDELALCGDEVEGFDDIVQAMEASDGAIVGYISTVTQGHNFTASTDDFYAEVNITLRVEETLRDVASSEPKVSMIHVKGRAEGWPAQIEAMQANIPSEKVVVLLRKRRDFPDLHRVLPPIGGLWTRTTRGALDNPIAHDDCHGHYGDQLNEQYLKGASTVEELVALLRD